MISPTSTRLSTFVMILIGSVILCLTTAVQSEELCCQNGCGSADPNTVASDLSFGCLQNMPQGDPGIGQCQQEAAHFVFADQCCANNGNDVDVVHNQLYALPTNHNVSARITDFDSYFAFVKAGGQLNRTSSGIEKRDFDACCNACKTINRSSSYCPRNKLGVAISASAALCVAACSYSYGQLCQF